MMIARLRNRFPALLALLCQLVAVALVFASLQLLSGLSGWRPTLMQAALAQGALAAGLGVWLGLSRWWLPINLLFVPGLVLAITSALPPWSYLLGFLVLLLVNWNSFGERVPLYLSGKACERKLDEWLAGQAPGFAFVDLGCGLAGTLCRLAKRYPQGHFVGVETAPLVFLVAWLRSLPLGNCRVRYLSLWKIDLAVFDVVYCFLSPAPMAALWRKAQAEMQPEALLVSNSFAVPGVAPSEEIPLEDWRQSRLLVWRMDGAVPAGLEENR